MKFRRLAVLSAAVVLLVGAGYLAVAKSDTPPAPRDEPEPGSSSTFFVRDRGNTRLLTQAFLISDSFQTLSTTITAAQAIDATQIVYSVGRPAGGNADAAVNTYFSLPQGGFMANAYVRRLDNIVINYSPPLQIRPGDVFTVNKADGSLGSSIRVEVTIFGYNPTVNRADGVMVQ